MADRPSITYNIKVSNTYDTKYKYLKWHKGQITHAAQKLNGIKTTHMAHIWHTYGTKVFVYLKWHKDQIIQHKAKWHKSQVGISNGTKAK